MAAQLRNETPPPRRRSHSTPEDNTVQQQVWSAKPGGNDWTESPLTRPKDHAEGSVNAKRDCLLPLKVNEDTCFSSPKTARFGEPAENLFPSPKIGSGGKENWQPAQGLRATPRTPLKTPSRLPTVQEHGGQGPMPSVDESEAAREVEPAWVVQSPVPAEQQELGEAMKGLGLSPVPPGLEDVRCELPKPSVRSTFIQFVSPLKTFSLMSPPKTEPVNFAPSTTAASSLFGGVCSDPFDDGSLAMAHSRMGDSPSPWFEHEQIPCFPAAAVAPPPPKMAGDNDEGTGAEQRQRGPVVRLAEFLPDPPAAAPSCQPPMDAGYGFNLPGLPMAPVMPSCEGAAIGLGMDGAPSSVCQQLLGMDSMNGTQQWHLPLLPQMAPEPMQQQLQESQPQSTGQQPQGQPDQSSLQQQLHLQQMQMQMQLQPPPQMQPQLSQMLQMQPPQMQQQQMPQVQMQPPQMQPPQMQPPQMPPQMQPDSLFLQQLMQMQMQPQMQPPSWPPLQPMPCVGEQMPGPPPQTVIEAAAPSVLCPSTCHQAQVCRCGEVRVAGDNSAPAPAMRAAGLEEQQPQQSSTGTAPSTCILLSAAMFPEMGN